MNVTPLRTNKSSLCHAALGYAQQGFDVFPVKEREKLPLVKWAKEATNDLQSVQYFWDKFPNANIAIATGVRSGIFVLDIDGEQGERSLQKLTKEHGELPVTAKQVSGNGTHYFFKSDQPIKTSAGVVAEGLDIRGDGGYIIASPSIHPSGRVYSWEIEPREVLSPAPDWLINLANKAKKKVPSVGNQKIPEGLRNDALFRHGCSLKRQGKGKSEIRAELTSINYRLCCPPLPDPELSKVLDSINEITRKNQATLFRWREFIRSAEFPKDPALKLVLHEIGFYMDKDGKKPAWPTEQHIAEATGLTRRTVCKKLKIAADKGFIKRQKHKEVGQKYFNYSYMIPYRFYPTGEI